MTAPAMKWHPAACIFPMMPDDELQELADDISQHGLREPITLFEGMVLDGRNRWVACRIAQVSPVTEEFNGTHKEALDLVLSLNLHRRHLTPSQASMCAARAKELYEQQAKERQKLSEGRGQKGMENFPDLKASTARDAAGKAFGVSGKSVDYAKKVIDKGIPELAKAVDEGRMAVSTAAVLASEPAEAQKEAIDRQAKRDYSKLHNKKPEPQAPRHKGEHNESEVFAIGKADVAITQLKGIPAKNKFRLAALRRVESWIESQTKGNKQ